MTNMPRVLPVLWWVQRGADPEPPPNPVPTGWCCWCGCTFERLGLAGWMVTDCDGLDVEPLAPALVAEAGTDPEAGADVCPWCCMARGANRATDATTVTVHWPSRDQWQLAWNLAGHATGRGTWGCMAKVLDGPYTEGPDAIKGVHHDQD